MGVKNVLEECVKIEFKWLRNGNEGQMVEYNFLKKSVCCAGIWLVYMRNHDFKWD